MKHLFTSLSICIITVSLVACNNENESAEHASTAVSKTVSEAAPAANKTSDATQTSQEASTEPNKTEEATNITAEKVDSAPPAEEPKPEPSASENAQQKPLNLNDFRNAIDEVVQDSFQEEVENTVEGEVSKKADK